MTRVSSLGICFVLMFSSLVASAEEFSQLSGRMDITYSEANPDYSPFSNGKGLGLTARIEYDESLLAYVRRSNASFRPSGPVGGIKVDLWQELGLGYQYQINDMWSFEGILSYQEVEQANETEGGHEIQLGTKFSPFHSLNFDLNLGKLDLQIDDWNLEFETRYTVFEQTYLVAKLRDYADWDFTYYEVGLGFYY